MLFLVNRPLVLSLIILLFWFIISYINTVAPLTQPYTINPDTPNIPNTADTAEVAKLKKDLEDLQDELDRKKKMLHFVTAILIIVLYGIQMWLFSGDGQDPTGVTHIDVPPDIPPPPL